MLPTAGKVTIFLTDGAFSSFRIALIRLAVSSIKAQNLLRMRDKIKEEVSRSAKIVALPVSML